MSKKPMTYYSSDWHLGHGNSERGIIVFERQQFKTIQEHDQYLLNLFKSWAEKWATGSELWFLGDFGDPSYLWIFDIFRGMGHTVHFLYGNHDRLEDFKHVGEHVDYVHQYPVYLSHKLVVSHEPVAVYEDQINIHGHLHSAILKDDNHINANVHVANYQPISQKRLDKIFTKIPKYTRRFLYEPYAKDYVFTQPKEDAIYDRNGRIDLSASRIQLKRMKEKKLESGNNSFVRDYVGGF